MLYISFLQLGQSGVIQYFHNTLTGFTPDFVHGAGVIERAFFKTHDAGAEHIEPFHRVHDFRQGDLVRRCLELKSCFLFVFLK